MLVQWHLDKQERSFVSRVGHAIQNFSLSPNYYALNLGDNTLKVVRVDNNKTVLSARNLNFSQAGNLSSFGKKVVVPSGSEL